MRRIFLSSTYIDLRKHRQVVLDALARMSLQTAAMEHFGARPQEPTEACLDELANCDTFVGVYAHRYGFIPAGSRVSVIEQEFDHAQKLGLPCYCYLVDPEYEWPRKYVEDGATESLEKFKRKV